MKLSRNAFIILLITFNILIDQITKFIVRAHVASYSQDAIIGDVLTLHNVENAGAFLGMGSELNPTLKILLLLILPVIILSLVVIHVFKEQSTDRLSLIGYCCIIGGGLANVFDRFAYGSVTDFLHLDFGGKLRTGIFNIADVSVTTGMIMILLASFIYKKTNKSNPGLN